MDTTVIRKLVFSAPFRRFVVTMNDGREFYIQHPELIAIANRSVFLIDEKTKRGIYLEPLLIASMQTDEE